MEANTTGRKEKLTKDDFEFEQRERERELYHCIWPLWRNDLDIQFAVYVTLYYIFHLLREGFNVRN